jgi:RNA polymerase sigma-70 factor (ECF subfamily)
VLGKPEAYDAGSGPLRAWFMRVVRNHCIDLIRRRRPATEDVERLSDIRPDPQAILETTQRDQQLHRALARLNNGQRQIIVLRDYMDLSYAEIALTLDIAQGTVMSRLHRARLALREELINHG